MPSTPEELAPFMINTPTGSVMSMLTPTGEAKLWATTADARHLAPAGHAFDSEPLAGAAAYPGMVQPVPVLRLSEVISPRCFRAVPDEPRGPATSAGPGGCSSEGSTVAESRRPSSVFGSELSLAALTSTYRGGAAQATAAGPSGTLAGNPWPELGTPELPTRGSAMHQLGACKPCAFTFKEGCSNGVECQFCHLCESGERKRRKKERLALRKESRLQAQRRSEAGGASALAVAAGPQRYFSTVSTRAR